MTTPRSLVLPLSIWAIFGFANTPVIRDFVQYGFDGGTYSHSYLVPFVCLALIWDAARNREFHFRPSVPMLIAATALAIFLSIAFVAQITILFRLLFPLALTGYLLAIYRPSASSIAAPAMLLFVVPVWGIFAAPLQAISVTAVTFIMGFTPIPTFVKGNFITIPYGTFEIAGGCSGLRYLIVAIAIGVLYSYLNLRTKRSYLLLLGIAIIGAMVVNWLRIVGLILIGFFSEMQSSLVEDHNTFGWYLFIPFLLLLFFVGRRLQESEDKFGLATNNHERQHEHAPVGRPFFALVLASIVAVSTVTFTVLAHWDVKSHQSALLTDIPEPAPNIVNPTTIEVRASSIEYRFSGREHDSKASYYGNRFIPNGWTAIEHWSDSRHQYIIVESTREDWGLVRYGFGAESNSTSSKLRYRLQRLVSAARLDASSALNWTFTKCSTASDCRRLYEPE